MYNNPKYSFTERITKVLTFDYIRKLKLLEIFQFTILTITYVFVIAYVFEKRYFSHSYKYFVSRQQKNKKKLDIYLLMLALIIETFVVIVILFYSRKILLLIPSMSSLMDSKFVGLTTFEFTIEIALVYLFLEFIPGYRNKIELILKYEFN